jgi:uncharacterized protein (TIGR03083 family)
MTDDVRHALRHSHQRLTELAGRLGPDDRRVPSYDAGWSVAQVFSHLGSGAEIMGLLLTAGLGQGPVPGPDDFGPIWERWNARSPDDQVTEALVSDQQLVDRFGQLSDAERAAFAVTFFAMDIDIDRLEAMRLAEHAVHTWDVAVTFDPAATVAPDAVAELVDGLGELVARAGRPSGAGVVRVRTTEPDREYSLVLADGASLERGAVGEADGELDGPAEAWLRLVYGRLDPAHTPAGVSGSGAGDLDVLRSVFPGF